MKVGGIGVAIVGALLYGNVALAQSTAAPEFRVLATTKTSTMEKELNESGDAGFRFRSVMGGETAGGGKESVTVVSRQPGTKSQYQYRLLATSRTSTMQKEIQEAADAGYEYCGQTVFDSLLGGREVVVIMERDRQHPSTGWKYKLLATSKTSTMESELKDAAGDGYDIVGLTVGKTLAGGRELVSITRRKVR